VAQANPSSRKGLVQIGGSAADLSDDQQARNPDILNTPLAVTSDLIEYNLFDANGTPFPSSVHLNFTAPLLSMIYNSTVICGTTLESKQSIQE
jgi:phosphate transport system substrate-binding protein